MAAAHPARAAVQRKKRGNPGGNARGYLPPILRAPTPAAGDEARGVDYHKARAVRETYSARLAKLEFEERTGKLISKDEVDIKYFQLARQLRDRMQQIPNKVAPEIVALVVDKPDVRGVADLIDRAIHQALEELVA